MYEVTPTAAAFVGRSPAACAVRAKLMAFGPVNATVLILGATGTGKELAARLVHDLSRRRTKPFVAIDAGALPDGLAESELFGHARGAFTGAVTPRQGLFAEADGGSIFLDEVSNMTLATQARLLRLLETREVRAIGSNQSRPVDVRVIAATNRDLRIAVSEGRFREDLLYRLDVLPLQLPTLAERREDIPALATHLLTRIEARCGASVCLSGEAERDLSGRDWPGNVRQLRNVLERGVALSGGGVIESAHIAEVPVSTNESVATPASWDRWLAEHERAFIVGQLEAHGWNRTATARSMGLSRQALYDKIHKYRLWPRLVAPASPARAECAPAVAGGVG